MRRWTALLGAGAILIVGCSDDTAKVDAWRDGDLYIVDQALQHDGGGDHALPDGSGKDVAKTDAPKSGDGPAGDGPTTDGAIPADCPKSEPTAGLACAQTGKQCGYGSAPECGNVWECYAGKWALAFQGTNCASVPPAGCSATQPSGFCTATAGPCRYDDVVCTCINVCSGQPPPVGQDHVWACAAPQTVACPSTTPTQASTCTSEGLVCKYGSCGGSTATCTNGKWNVVTLPPPP